MNRKPLLQHIWNLCCSLKLAIVLASAATFLAMAGSLFILYYPKVFGAMDQMVLGRWMAGPGAANLQQSWWLFAAAGLILLLGLNTLGCLLDWLFHLRSRWRKTGEYLIHAGFVMILAAYVWGSLAGFRSSVAIKVGDTAPIDQRPGYALRLDAFEPYLDDRGRPMDMINTVTLLKDDIPIVTQTLRSNAPLSFRGLVILGASYGQLAEGFRFLKTGTGVVTLTPGTSLSLAGGGSLQVHRFLPDALRTPEGDILGRGQTLRAPALELELVRPQLPPWRGWYLLQEGLPLPLVQAGVRLWPTEPVYRPYSLLTVNDDPGSSLALIGASAMTLGILLALGSFYTKRRRGDRPEIT